MDTIQELLNELILLGQLLESNSGEFGLNPDNISKTGIFIIAKARKIKELMND